ncbi:OmpA family protein [Sandaracinobacteroides saxicola]|uniref:OmpA family protein n=1 Tax=Sandaracinobacteroides saxicola TaxID=2759707 RepID=A0A7G5IHK9_9SPHN|nr:OmpA family protein [Sandaracinobacteroides saxicola]QMW22851.1 OmpA family protein [Sandaracinobacteroides saxicola]
MADNPIETMTPGQILTDTSVANFIKAMGISIAEAQLQLDLNSLAQVGEYVQPREGLGGKSLLQLGLSPPFYHYQHADLTVSLQLTMKVGRTEAFGIGGRVDFGLNNGPGAASGTPANARLAQVTLTAMPASVTVAGTRLEVTGADLETAANGLADRLRMPTGRFDRVFVNNTARDVTLALTPGSATNPVLSRNAVAFLPTARADAALIRISNTPTAGANEVYTLASGKVATVNSEADSLAFARSVRTAIAGLGGFNARLVRDANGATTAPDAPGAIAIALFDTGSSVLKPAALTELGVIASILRGGTQAITVSGFTDRQGGEANNVRLGSDRATRVRDQLIALGIAASRITTVLPSTGETRWAGTPNGADNAQFRRAEVTIPGNDHYIVVESAGTNLQATPTPNRTDGSAGNGFVALARSSAQAVDATAVNVGTAATAVAVSGAAVNSDGTVFATDSPEAFAFNLARDINAGSATNGARATRRGAVVFVARADDAIVLDLLTLGTADITLAADGGARISQPLASAAGPGSSSTPTADPNRTNYALAVGISVDYRTSRMFEQSVNGNSSISARIVSIPAPVEFLDEIRTFLAPQPATPTPSPTPTPTPTPTP